jgi:hypothetical protein
MSSPPLSHQELVWLGQAPGGNGRPWSAGRDLAIFLNCRGWATVNFGGRPPLCPGYSELNPPALKLCSMSRTRAWLVNATFAMAATSMPWAGSSTICVRRQVTTDAARAHDLHQAPALIVIDRAHPQASSHPASPRDQHQQREPPGQARPQGKRDLLQH